jgi:hypothetical protein
LIRLCQRCPLTGSCVRSRTVHRGPVACRQSMLPTECDFCWISTGKLNNLSETDSPILSILPDLTQNYFRSWFDTSPRTEIHHVMDAESFAPRYRRVNRTSALAFHFLAAYGILTYYRICVASESVALVGSQQQSARQRTHLYLQPIAVWFPLQRHCKDPASIQRPCLPNRPRGR